VNPVCASDRSRLEKTVIARPLPVAGRFDWNK